jgi:hypothetical protein
MILSTGSASSWNVAQRAPGTAQNDAARAAVQVINRPHDYPRQIAPRPFPSREHVDKVASCGW